ncbi:hypothetical protein [Falsiroseomonas sp. HW251]
MALLSVVLLAKSLAPALGVAAPGAPFAVVGVVIARSNSASSPAPAC